MMHRVIQCNIRLEVQFTDKLPHGPYGEQLAIGTYALYLPEDATLELAKSTFLKRANEEMQQQAELVRNASCGARMHFKLTPKSIRCKGAIMTDDSIRLCTILESGDAMELLLLQNYTSTPMCCTLS